MFSNSQSAPVTPAHNHMSTRAHAAQERPSAPSKSEVEEERHGDLHVRGTEKLSRSIRRNMTNGWVHYDFDGSAACWHFTNGADSTRAWARLCVWCQGDKSLVIFSLTLVHKGSPPVRQQPIWNSASLTELEESLASLVDFSSLNQLLRSKRLTVFYIWYYLSFALRSDCPVSGTLCSSWLHLPSQMNPRREAERKGAFSCHCPATATSQMQGRSRQTRSHLTCWGKPKATLVNTGRTCPTCCGRRWNPQPCVVRHVPIPKCFVLNLFALLNNYTAQDKFQMPFFSWCSSEAYPWKPGLTRVSFFVYFCWRRHPVDCRKPRCTHSYL